MRALLGLFPGRVCVMGHRMASNVVKAVALLATAMPPFASCADELTSPVASQAFVFGGIDAGKDSVFAWSGFTAIPFAKIGEDGFRLRTMGGYGRYRYRTSAVADGENTGTITSGELLAGNRTSFGGTVLTGYVGLDAKNYRLQNADPKNPELEAALESKRRSNSLREPRPTGLSRLTATFRVCSEIIACAVRSTTNSIRDLRSAPKRACSEISVTTNNGSG
jgi:hypothetical protein